MAIKLKYSKKNKIPKTLKFVLGLEQKRFERNINPENLGIIILNELF